MTQNLLMRVFVPNGSQLLIDGSWKHLMEVSDDGRQGWRLIAGVELQDGRLQDKTKLYYKDTDARSPKVLTIQLQQGIFPSNQRRQQLLNTTFTIISVFTKVYVQIKHRNVLQLAWCTVGRRSCAWSLLHLWGLYF